MRTIGFVIFFSVFLSVYGLLNFYIFTRGLQSIPQGSTLRHAYTVIFWLAAASFLAGRVLERYWTSPLSDLLVWAGSFWIAAMFYFLLAAVLFDTIRLIHAVIPIYPAWVAANYSQVKYAISAAVIGLVSVLLIAGHINALLPRVNTLDLSIEKKAGPLKSLNIVAASDIHLGTIVGRSRLDHLVESINSLDPDLVLLPGDIVDEDLAPVIKQNLGEALFNIRSKYGVYAVTGNHEYIGGAEEACSYLGDHNVTMLRDRAVRIDDCFYLVGREDRARHQFSGQRRKPLGEIMAGIDRTLPVILMDHQPFELDQAVKTGADLQISGHTHQGQLWPVNYIIRAIYEIGWGYRKIGGTHFYVSNGYGTWGPPVRIGHRPEIFRIRLKFDQPR
jgi:uncharacterized protein